MYSFYFCLGISFVITTVTGINSLISDSSCIAFLSPLLCLIQTELSLINIDYDLSALTHNVKICSNLTTRLFFPKRIYDQIVLVCVTNFGHIRNKGLISAQLVEGKEDGDEWEWIGMGGRVRECMLVGGGVWD